MDRARAEVKTAEERKCRRVQRALALAILGLLAVAGGAAWWIDSVRSHRRADQEAQNFRNEAELKEREAERRTRQIALERDVRAAIDEADIRLREGHEQTEDTLLWWLTLRNAEDALKRAEKILESGEPDSSLRQSIAARWDRWKREHRDRTLITEINRISDSNEIRLLMPVSFSNVTSSQYESAFRKFGIDLLAVPPSEAVAWLKDHRLRDRLVVAIRLWHYSLPQTEIVPLLFDFKLIEAIYASGSVASEAVVAAILNPARAAIS